MTRLRNMARSSNSTTERLNQQHRCRTNHIFRYARWYDIVFMICGGILGVVAGCCLPIIILLFGQAVTEFTSYTIAFRIRLVSSESNVSNTSEYFCNSSDDQILMDYIESSDINQLLMHKITVYICYIFGIAITLFVSSFLSNLLWKLSGTNQAKCARIAFHKALLEQSVSWYDVNSPELLLSRLTDDVQKFEDGIGIKTVNFIKEVTTVVAAFVISVSISWKLTLSISSFIPFLLIIIIIMAKVTSAVAIKEQTALSMAGEVVETAFSAIKTVVAFGGEDEEYERYRNFLMTAKASSYKKHVTYGFIYAFFSLAIFAMYGFGLWYGIHILLNCEVSSGGIFIILFEVASSCLNLNDALPLLASIATAFGVKTGIFFIIDQNIKDEDYLITLNNMKGHIVFSDVKFSYPSRPDIPILQGLNLIIKEGQTVALVGPSGCGKSTVLHLLQQMYRQDAGTITIDGIDITEINLMWLRNEIAVVSQEPVIFNVTIAENIAFGKEGATEEDIKRAAIEANAYDFILLLPNGFNTLVGDAGTQLSGGQKQRIAIARALVRDPKILLLDEATSALDTESEKLVEDSLRMIKHQRTTIIVAHRLSTIQSADIIATIDKGVVVEVGSHTELMNKNGLYSKLVHNQTIDNETHTEHAEFNKAYRQSIHRQRSKKLSKKPSFFEESLEHRPPDRKRSLFVSLTRRVSEGLIQVSELQTVHSPVNNFLPQLSSYEEEEIDDVFESTEPSFHVQDSHAKPASWSILFKLIKPVMWWLMMGIASVILIAFMLSAIYIVFSDFLRIFTDFDSSELAQHYLIVYLAVGLLSFILHFVSVFSLGVASDHLTTHIRCQLFSNLLQQDLSFFDEPENSVTILSQRLVFDASQVNQAVGLSLGITVRGIFIIIIAYVVALQAAWLLGLLSLLSLVPFLIGGFIQFKLTKMYRKIQYLNEEGNRIAIESIENVFTVQLLGLQKKFVEKYKVLLQKPFWYNVVTATVQSALHAAIQASQIAITAVLVCVGAFIYTSNEDSVYYADLNDIMRASGAMLYISLIFKGLFNYLIDAESARICASKIFKLMNTEPLTKGHASIEGQNANYNIRLLDICFVYPARPLVPVLQQLNLTIQHGKTIALVGTSGSGKSTIISLIERFYNPSGGKILIDGNDISILDISWFRRQISLVSQEPVLFNMSIADNIRYGALYRTVTNDEVINAAKVANIHDFIITLPQGYETYVGLRGTQLSGGQKQRIAIARALVRDPKVLLLDEATSALDTESEKIVQDALDAARQGRTTIVIAHRLSTISNSDNIVVLHKGQLKEQGTHTELMKKKGAYYFMNNIVTQ